MPNISDEFQNGYIPIHYNARMVI